jgi:hypothetical protein
MAGKPRTALEPSVGYGVFLLSKVMAEVLQCPGAPVKTAFPGPGNDQ